MFSGRPTHIITALVVIAQLMSSLFLSIAIPAPSSLARASETRVVLEASDVMADDAVRGETLSPQESDEQESLGSETGIEADSTPDPSLWEEGICETWEENAYETWEEDAYEAWAPSAYGSAPQSDGSYAASELKTQGVICDGDYRYTWYSQRVLPGGGLEIEGRHVSDEGYVVDAEERIVVASSDLDRGTELEVPFGSGKAVVLDTGCASGTIDIYTDF